MISHDTMTASYCTILLYNYIIRIFIAFIDRFASIVRTRSLVNLKALDGYHCNYTIAMFTRISPRPVWSLDISMTYRIYRSMETECWLYLVMSKFIMQYPPPHLIPYRISGQLSMRMRTIHHLWSLIELSPGYQIDGNQIYDHWTAKKKTNLGQTILTDSLQTARTMDIFTVYWWIIESDQTHYVPDSYAVFQSILLETLCTQYLSFVDPVLRINNSPTRDKCFTRCESFYELIWWH